MIGIEDLQVYGGRFSLSIRELARARGMREDYVEDELMCHTRSVYPAWEDTVTLAVNAARPLVERRGSGDIRLLIVATESAVDHGKPVSTWVHRFCGLGEHCRSFELKHACYGGTGALKTAAAWVQQEGGRALVVSADVSRMHLGHKMEYICGGAAVAMIVGPDAGVLELEPGRSGYWTSEVADTFRPTAREEVGNDQLSLYSYLDALEGSFAHYEQLHGPCDYRREFVRHVYHAPFPAMTWQAHRTLLAGQGEADMREKREDFEARVAPGLRFSRQIGTSYGASTFLGLMSLLAGDGAPGAGDALSIFSYGSGCQGEFYRARVGLAARERAGAWDLPDRLEERMPLGMEAYEAFERERDAAAETRDLGDGHLSHPLYGSCYRGENLLVLRSIDGYNRNYTWS